MKKLITLTMALAILATAASASFAQGRSRRTNSCDTSRSSNVSTNYDSRYDSRRNINNSRAYDNSVYDNRAYYDYGSGQYRGRSVWDRHRDKITVVAGTAGGAAIGGLIGGRRGAVIGAISGAAGSALYTYKIRHKGYRY